VARRKSAGGLLVGERERGYSIRLFFEEVGRSQKRGKRAGGKPGENTKSGCPSVEPKEAYSIKTITVGRHFLLDPGEWYSHTTGKHECDGLGGLTQTPRNSEGNRRILSNIHRGHGTRERQTTP